MTTREEDVMRKALEKYADSLEEKLRGRMHNEGNLWGVEEAKIARSLVSRFCVGGSAARRRKL
jgi:hypothetical protein